MATKTLLALVAASAATLIRPSLSFQLSQSSPPTSFDRYASTTSQYMFFANEVQEEASFQVTPLDGNDESIQAAAVFMVDSFWLQSPQALSDGSVDISADAKSSLVNVQTKDLMNKYGERLGKRKLDAVMLAANDDTTTEMIGMVTVEVRLLDSISKAILNADRSELMLTNAISALGPKQRREYKDASVIDVANALLPPEISAVCSFSNLCVSPNARRRGVAAKLCKEAELLAKKLGFDEMYLCVESGNSAARSLYIDKLGYGNKFETTSKSLRVDGNTGTFDEVDVEIMIVNKKI